MKSRYLTKFFFTIKSNCCYIKHILLDNTKFLYSVKSRKKWLYKHINDPYVKLARSPTLNKKENINDKEVFMYRARSAYKLIDILDKYKILDNLAVSRDKLDFKVLDLGCSPGSWCQVLLDKLKRSIKNNDKQVVILGVDKIRMEHISDKILFVEGDFEDSITIHRMLSLINNDNNNLIFDLILSDMSPNLSGNKTRDMNNLYNLCIKVIEFSDLFLAKTTGNLIFKVFMSNEENILYKELLKRFQKVHRYKPKASRKESSEHYLVAINKK